jgi:STAS domain
VAGPWVAELSRIWVETVPQLKSRELILDLRNVTYADSAGMDALKTIYAQSKARLIAGSPWTEYLADEIRKNGPENVPEEVEHAKRA